MRRLVPLLLAALAGTASADGFYFTESGGGTRVKDELGTHMGGGVRIRIGAGMRRGQWAIEGWVAGVIVNHESDKPSQRPTYDRGFVEPTSLTTYGFDLKYLKPIASNVEVYLRGSMSRGHMSGTLDGYEGRGLGAGAGIQLKGKVRALGFLAWPLFFTKWGPKVTAALVLDSGYEFYRLHGQRRDGRANAIDAKLSHMTFGFAVGSDF